VAPNLTVDTFADQFDGETRILSIPVVDDEAVLGVIGVRRLQRLGRRKFATTRAADVMTVPPQAPFLAPSDDLWTAVDQMNQLGQEGLAVVDDGKLVGMITRDSVGEVVRRRTAERTGGRPAEAPAPAPSEAAGQADPGPSAPPAPPSGDRDGPA
jgi:predicted transcriptional regulator